MKRPTTKQVFAWGSLSLILGAARLIWAFIPFSIWMWIALLAAVGCATFCIYLTERSDWSLLLPPYLMWSIAGLLILNTSHILQYKDAALYVLPAIALPFMVTFVRNRNRWWALLVAYILLTIGVLVGLIVLSILNNLLIGAYVLLAIAMPFFTLYARDHHHRWSRIPGGISALIGIGLLIAGTVVMLT